MDNLLDELSRKLATTTSRRDAVRVILVAIFGGTSALACVTPTSPKTSCSAGSCMGSDGKCYGPCATGSCTTNPSGNCSTASAGGVYCCVGSGGTCRCTAGNTYNFASQTCCPNSTPYYYPGTHGIKPAGCYASCPYVGDCGTTYQKC